MKIRTMQTSGVVVRSIKYQTKRNIKEFLRYFFISFQQVWKSGQWVQDRVLLCAETQQKCDRESVIILHHMPRVSSVNIAASKLKVVVPLEF